MSRYLLYACFLLFFCCKGKEYPVSGLPAIDTAKPVQTVVPGDPRLSPISSVLGFLAWYRDNETWVNDHHYIDGGLKDSSTFYHINWYKAEDYLFALRSSHFLSENYLQDLKQYLASCDSLMKKIPQNDGPPIALDFDLVIKSQDYQDIYDSLSVSKVIDQKINGNKAELVIRHNSFRSHRYYLTKYGNYWLLDSNIVSFRRLFSESTEYLRHR